MVSVFKMCIRFAKRKPSVFFTTVVVVILMYVTFLFYVVCCRDDMKEPSPLSSYVLSFNGQSLYESDYLDAPARPNRGHQTCKERRNFVFIKIMKCATSTLLGVFYRFGYTRNVSFVSPNGNKMYLNWPFPMSMLDFRPSSRGYNILTDHAIFTESVMTAIMPKDTIYISIIREPFAQLKSVFQYFRVDEIAGVPKDVPNPVVEYFSHLDKYEAAYTDPSAKTRWCVPDGFSMTRNLMSHSLGMPLGFPPGSKNITNDTAAVDAYIDHLNKKFSLIMIVEHFYESLVLLRRLMCWEFKDIIFVNANVAKYDFKAEAVPNSTLELHKKWSAIDYKLYNFFNATLWKHISRQGVSFNAEVEAFKDVESRVGTYCRDVYKHKGAIPTNLTSFSVEESDWTRAFSFTSRDCLMLGPNPYDLLHVVQKENDLREAKLVAEWSKRPDNRTLKSAC